MALNCTMQMFPSSKVAVSLRRPKGRPIRQACTSEHLAGCALAKIVLANVLVHSAEHVRGGIRHRRELLDFRRREARAVGLLQTIGHLRRHVLVDQIDVGLQIFLLCWRKPLHELHAVADGHGVRVDLVKSRAQVRLDKPPYSFQLHLQEGTAEFIAFVHHVLHHFRLS